MNSLKSPFIYAIMLVVITLPLKWIQINSIALIILLLVWILAEWKTKFVSVTINWRFKVLLMSFFLLGIFSLLYSQNISVALSKIETRITLLFFPLVIFNFNSLEKADFNLILKAFVWSCSLVAFCSIAHTFYINYSNEIYLNGNTSWFFSSENLMSKFGFHPSYFTIYCAFSVFILFYLFNRREATMITFVLSTLFFSAVIFLLASRIGIIAYLTILSVTAIYEFHKRRKIWLGIFVTLFMLIVIGFLASKNPSMRNKFTAMVNYDLNQYSKPFSIDKRLDEWRSTIILIKKNFVLGTGIGDMQDELNKVYLEQGFLEGVENSYNPHNLFLDAVATLGILGLMAIVSLFFVSFYYAIRKKDILHLQFLLLFVFLSIPESTFSVQKGVVFFTCFNCLFLSLTKDEGFSDNEQ